MNTIPNISSSVTVCTSSKETIVNDISTCSKAKTQLEQATAKNAESNVNLNEKRNKKNRESHARRKDKLDEGIKANDQVAIDKKNKRKDQNRINQQFKRLKTSLTAGSERTISQLKTEITQLKKDVSQTTNEWEKDKEIWKGIKKDLENKIITSEKLQTNHHNKSHNQISINVEEKDEGNSSSTDLVTKIEELNTQNTALNKSNREYIDLFNNIVDDVKKTTEEKKVLDSKISTLKQENQTLNQELIDSKNKYQYEIQSTNSTIKSLMEEKTKPLGLTSIFGLHNPQNMCYRNVALQLLHSCSDFVSIMKQQIDNKTNETNLPLSRSIHNLFQHKSSLLVESEEFQDNTCVVIDCDQVSKIVQIKKKDFSTKVYEQNDPVEFLYYLLDRISSELGLPPVTKSMFGIDIEDVWKCKSCEKLRVHTCPGKNIDLSFPPLNKRAKQIHIKKLFQHTFADCNMEDVVCENCKQKNTTTKSFKTVKCQNYVMLQLQRMYFDKKKREYIWIDIPISNDCVTIDIEEFLPSIDISNGFSTKYELIAMIVKNNTDIEQGHYVAKCKKKTNEGTFEWFTFNDDKVEVMKETKHDVKDRKGMTFMIYKQIEKDNAGSTNSSNIQND